MSRRRKIVFTEDEFDSINELIALMRMNGCYHFRFGDVEIGLGDEPFFEIPDAPAPVDPKAN